MGKLPKRNKGFSIEKHVHFALASGRNVATMRSFFQSLPISSTPAVILNGAGVYDYDHEKMLWFQELNPSGYEIVKAVTKKFPLI